MVIYDTNNNYNGRINGRLYMSMIDVDYLVKKYGISELRSMIPKDYVEAFERELESREGKLIFSPQYYSILPIGIETESDERLLSLLSQEVESGNIFAKSQLSSLSLEQLEKEIKALEDVRVNPSEASLEDIYKLRSFMMAEFILMNIDGYNRSVEKAYGAYLDINKKDAKKDIITINKNFEAMGITGDITESEYFDKAIMMAKRLTENK